MCKSKNSLMVVWSANVYSKFSGLERQLSRHAPDAL
jgi:hypothetical protein